MYARLDIPRDDKAARRQWFARNYAFFDAPLALFCSVDRRMGPPQWSDLGMLLQSVMLLLRGEGLLGHGTGTAGRRRRFHGNLKGCRPHQPA